MARHTNAGAFSDSAVVPGNGNNSGQSACPGSEVSGESAMTETGLGRIMSAKKNVILKKWLDAIMPCFPSAASNHFRMKGDSFANPTGSTLSAGLEDMLDELISRSGRAKTEDMLGGIIRVMAVQDMPPSQSLSFFFYLKRIVREEAGTDLSDKKLAQEVLSLEAMIDSLALSVFDIFMKCREKIYEIKANEARRANFRLLQMADRIDAVNGCRPAPKGNNPNTNEER